MIERLQSWVAAQAQQRPEATAMVLQGERMTYGRLEEISNQLARMLIDGGCRRGDRVCLLLPKSTVAIAGILGVLKAGCIYVPLDPSCPAARLAKIVETCQNRWILAGGSASPVLKELAGSCSAVSGMRIGWLDECIETEENCKPAFSFADLSALSSAPLDSDNTSSDPAYIMFTSGSTGSPKGVVITHSNVVHFIKWAVPYFGISDADRLSCHSPLHFDLSVFDIFGAFAAGAELHLVAPELKVLPNKLADFIRDSKLTQWFSVPSALNYMAKFDVVKPNDFPALKRLLWCGEVLPVPALTYFMKRLPHVSFTNLYGPTEATIASSYYTVPYCPSDDRAFIPIGGPCGGENLYVLDEKLRPVEAGATGHLYIQGAGLSPGYYKDPEKTNEVFLRNPFGSDPSDRLYKTGDLAKVGEDGLVYFLGRSDSQIKSRGHRIELGEVSTALSALEFLRESAVVAIPTSGFEGVIICCAYVALPHRDVSPAALRNELTKVLPRYMLPTRWIAMSELPKNANGKIDTRLVKEQFPAAELI
ncbi:MAG TPA: amino acid adenylation domain-containing protein [Bryobacteraceae bacterium]|nr:amino acid adenylation domain-containing protein [Bryobacteraceae bacterium]